MFVKHLLMLFLPVFLVIRGGGYGRPMETAISWRSCALARSSSACFSGVDCAPHERHERRLAFADLGRR
eukprot:5453614-Amphidinium_carterae.1